jgi:hypothetical protein
VELQIVVEPVAVNRWDQQYTGLPVAVGRRVLRLVLAAQVVDTQLRVQQIFQRVAAVA